MEKLRAEDGPGKREPLPATTKLASSPSGEGSSVMMRMLNTPELDALEKDLMQNARRSKPARGARRKLLRPAPAPETHQMREASDASHAEAPEVRTSTANLSLQENHARAAAHVPKLRLSAMGEPSVVRVDALQLQCEDGQAALSARSRTIENIRAKVAHLRSPPSAILRAANPGGFSIAGVAQAEPLRPSLQNEGEITSDLMFPTGSPAVIPRDAPDCQIEDLRCATEALEKARKYSTGEAQALVQLGEVYEYMGLYAEAREYYLECTQDSRLLLDGDSNVSTYIQRARFRLGMLAFKDGNLQIAIGEVEACFSAYLASSCIEGLCRSQLVLAYLHVLWEACGLFPLMDRLQMKAREDVLPTCVGEKHGNGIKVAEDLINDYVYLIKCQLESSALASTDAREDQTRMESAVEKMSGLRVNMDLKVHEIHVRFVEGGGSVAEDVHCEKEEARKRVRDIVDTHTQTLLKVLHEYRAALKAGRSKLISPEASEGLEDLCWVLAGFYELSSAFVEAHDVNRRSGRLEAAAELRKQTRDIMAASHSLKLAAEARRFRAAARDWPMISSLCAERAGLSRRLKRRNDECEALGLEGEALARQGQLASALSLCRRHLTLVDELEAECGAHADRSNMTRSFPRPQRQLAALDLIAQEAKTSGQLEKAVGGYMMLLKEAKLRNDKVHMARACRQLSGLMLAARDLDGVAWMCMVHVEVAEDMDDDCERSLAHGTAATACLMLGDVENGLTHCRQQQYFAREVCVKAAGTRRHASALMEPMGTSCSARAGGALRPR